MRLQIIKLILLGTALLIMNSFEAKTTKALEEEVKAVESAFAQSMADRDFEKFKSFLDDEAVFVSTERTLRGKEQVAAAWKTFFKSPEAPFSWQPETVVALESGQLALSTGPISNEAGTVVAYYNSVWRKTEEGHWKIILDKGQKYCG